MSMGEEQYAYYRQGYEQGQRDALAGAVVRVEALYRYEDGHRFMADEGPTEETVIATIKGDSDE